MYILAGGVVIPYSSNKSFHFEILSSFGFNPDAPRGGSCCASIRLRTLLYYYFHIINNKTNDEMNAYAMLKIKRKLVKIINVIC